MSFKKDQIIRGLIIRPDDIAADGIEGEIKVGLTAKKLQVYLDGALRSVVTEAQVQTLTNKTLTSAVLNVGVSGTAIDTDGTLAANSDTILATQKAVKTYVDVQLVTQDAANEIAFTPAGTISATNVQAAIVELDGDIQTHIADTTTHGVGSNIVGVSDAQSLTNKTIIVSANTVTTSANGNLTSTELNAALAELQSDIDTRATLSELGDHINDATGAHAASAISNTPSGNLAATTVQAALNELQGDIDTINADIADDVEGPASSTDNALVRFDGTTGKLIQNSTATLSDAGDLVVSNLTVDSTNINGSVLSIPITGALVNFSLSGTNHIYSLTDKHTHFGAIVHPVTANDTTAGANATITVGANKNIHLTGALTSIDMLVPTTTSFTAGQEVTLINKTGSAFIINNDTGATTLNRVLTGTGGNISVPADGSISLVYTSSKWSVIGGAGNSDTSFTIANNQVAVADVTGLVVSGATYRGFVVDYTIYRKTDTALSGVAQMGELKAVYNTQSSTWLMSDAYSGQNAGVTFSITSAGQVQYTSTNITGATYAGTMKFNIRKQFTL